MDHLLLLKVLLPHPFKPLLSPVFNLLFHLVLRKQFLLHLRMFNSQGLRVCHHLLLHLHLVAKYLHLRLLYHHHCYNKTLRALGLLNRQRLLLLYWKALLHFLDKDRYHLFRNKNLRLNNSFGKKLTFLMIESLFGHNQIIKLICNSMTWRIILQLNQLQYKKIHFSLSQPYNWYLYSLKLKEFKMRQYY